MGINGGERGGGGWKEREWRDKGGEGMEDGGGGRSKMEGREEDRGERNRIEQKERAGKGEDDTPPGTNVQRLTGSFSHLRESRESPVASRTHRGRGTVGALDVTSRTGRRLFNVLFSLLFLLRFFFLSLSPSSSFDL